ncbi:hypothetical protein Pst134EA_031663 [Puccinia striiformis f. sp. tritici]|nr:uncharacterized protein Pst134EA_031663 [Puccinia striiformis f. sp. tritici]KAH9442694.1 hypothetical protein Pst134EA_031663 [Puccinia striiformis f. sp. tritici]
MENTSRYAPCHHLSNSTLGWESSLFCLKHRILFGPTGAPNNISLTAEWERQRKGREIIRGKTRPGCPTPSRPRTSQKHNQQNETVGGYPKVHITISKSQGTTMIFLNSLPVLVAITIATIASAMPDCPYGEHPCTIGGKSTCCSGCVRPPCW